MDKTKIKSLGQARDIIAQLEAKTGYKRASDKEPIRTLDGAKKYISFLQSKQTSPTPIAPVGSLPALAKPAVKIPAEAKKLVTSNLSVLPSLESIKAELESATSTEARIKLLSAHAANYRAKIKAEKDLVAQTQLLRQLNRIEKRAALELYADPVAWKNRNRQPKDL